MLSVDDILAMYGGRSASSFIDNQPPTRCILAGVRGKFGANADYEIF